MKRSHYRILAPFTSVEHVGILKNAGADELYCGYVNEESAKRWPLAFGVLNRRGEGQSFESYKIFKEAVAEAQKCDLPVYVTVNGLYTPEQYPYLFDLLSMITSLQGVKGIIVTDLGLLLTLKKNDFKKEIHISTGATIFNSHAVDFYGDMGAERVVLDRQLTADEIADVVSQATSKIDVEIFVISAGCGGFIDGFCTFFHCFEIEQKTRIGKKTFLGALHNTNQENRGCLFHKQKLESGDFKFFSAVTYKEEKRNLSYQRHKDELVGCRICDLYKLNKYRIRCLKIVGRGGAAADIAKKVRLIYDVRSWLEKPGISEIEYRRKCKDKFSKVYLGNRRHCSKFDCYFDAHWIKR